MAQNLPINRAKGVNRETAEAFYNIVLKKKEELEKIYGVIPAENWWNTVESGYCGDQGQKIILCRKGTLFNIIELLKNILNFF
jgi:hypothetical protein